MKIGRLRIEWDKDPKKLMHTALPAELEKFMKPALQQGLADTGLRVNWKEVARRMCETTGWQRYK